MAYTENELKERQHDKMNPRWMPVIIDGKETEYLVNQNGDVSKTDGKHLNGHRDKSSGYLIYTITVDKIQYHISAHRLVAEAFVPNPDKLSTVKHINGKKDDDWYKNLRWSTGEAEYTEEQIKQCCQYIQEGRSNGWIAESMGVAHFLPKRLRNGSYRTDITSQYQFPTSPQHEGTRGISSEVVHKICRLLEYDIGATEISKIFPEISKARIQHIKNGTQYTDISKQYKFPEVPSRRGDKSNSDAIARLGVGYEYEQVIAALTKLKK